MINGSVKVVGAVIFDEADKKLLVGQRSRNGKNPLKWEFIGGKVENGEDLLSAAEREFFEETGAKIKARKVIGKSSFNYGGKMGKVKVYFVECDVFSGKPVVDKSVYEKVEWVPKERILTLDWIEADRDFVRKLAR